MDDRDKSRLRRHVVGLLSAADPNDSLVDSESLLISGKLGANQFAVLMDILEDFFEVEFPVQGFDKREIDTL